MQGETNKAPIKHCVWKEVVTLLLNTVDTRVPLSYTKSCTCLYRTRHIVQLRKQQVLS